jgi:hypothetical protein
LGALIEQISWQTSTDGIEFMDSMLKTLKATLEAIRDMTMKALNQIAESQEEHSTQWKCKGLFHWKPLADARDAKVRRLDLFCETMPHRQPTNFVRGSCWRVASQSGRGR